MLSVVDAAAAAAAVYADAFAVAFVYDFKRGRDSTFPGHRKVERGSTRRRRSFVSSFPRFCKTRYLPPLPPPLIIPFNRDT